MVRDSPGLSSPLGDMSLEGNFSVKPYSEPPECGLLPCLWACSDRVNGEFIVNNALWCMATGFLGQMDHLKLLWCKKDLVLSAPGQDVLYIASQEPDILVK
jgi:hypothetical protein